MGKWRGRRCGEPLNRDTEWGEHGRLDERSAKYVGPLMRWTRHTAIRNMTNAGLPLQRVMQVTGHRHVPTHLAYNVPAESDLEMMEAVRRRQEKGQVMLWNNSPECTVLVKSFS